MERAKLIKDTLNGIGTDAGTLYTNQEIVDRLIALQSAMARGVFEKTHAENLRDRDLMIHFEALAKEYSLDTTDTYLRFRKNMNELGHTIANYLKGRTGEKIAKKAFYLIEKDERVKILYNVQLEDGDYQTEYDAIVVAPYGLFVIEVKNWGKEMSISHMGLLSRSDENTVVYDLAGRMSIKEALLMATLKDKFPSHYTNVLLFPNEKTIVDDNYHKMLISCGAGLSYVIRDFERESTCHLSQQQIGDIVKTIQSKHKEQKTTCQVNCDEIINDYAELMVLIENAAKVIDEDNIRMDICDDIQMENTSDEKEMPWYTHINWPLALGSAALAIPLIITVVSSKKGR